MCVYNDQNQRLSEELIELHWMEIIYDSIVVKFQGDKVYNVTQSKSEKTGRLYIANADELAEVSLMSEGSIAVVSGLKVSLHQMVLNSRFLVISD